MDLTYDCPPTLTDSQVLEFCKTGLLRLDTIVPDEINKRVFQYCNQHDGAIPATEDWYIENVTLNPQVFGPIRSLLGRDFTYPTAGGNHRVQGPIRITNGWHNDGGSTHKPNLDCLQVFYSPQDTPKELGPTEFLPGSHLLFSLQPWMRHYGNIRGSVSTAAPAGSIFLTAYSIWHRRTSSTADEIRNLIKYWYKRTVPPERDWIQERGFQPKDAKQSQPGFYFHHEHHRTINDVAEMFYWLCGMEDEYSSVNNLDNNLPIFLSK